MERLYKVYKAVEINTMNGENRRKGMCWRVIISFKKKRYCTVYGRTEEEAEGRAEELLDQFKLTEKDGLIRKLVKAMKSLMAHVNAHETKHGMLISSAKNQPTAEDVIKEAEEITGLEFE